MDIRGLWPALRLPSSAAKALLLLRGPVLEIKISKASECAVKLQVDRAGGAMTLLADDDLGLAVGRIHLGLPLDMLVGARPRLLVAEVVLLAEHEHDHVGILLDR